MKRTAKFRGRRENGEWLYGSLVTNSGKSYIHYFTRTDSMTREDRMLVDSDTTGQFAEFYDKNGNEVYEGDILMMESIKSIIYKAVWWNPDRFTFYIGDNPVESFMDLGEHDRTLKDFTIVGTIYDGEMCKLSEDKA